MTSDLSKKELLAERYLQKGNLVQALKIFENLQKQESKIAHEGIIKCHDLLLRKHWKQQKSESFLALVKENPKHSLVKARLLGKNALELLAKENSEEGFFAQCLLFDTSKEAFLHMRRNPKYKKFAEGWLAFLKGDITKAIIFFIEAKKEDDLRAKIGLGLVSLLRGQFQKAQECFFEFYPLFKKQFPHLLKVLHWDGLKTPEVLIKEHKVFQLLKKGSKQEIEEILGQIDNHQKEIKGRLFLRLGDITFAKNKDKSCIGFWKKAKGYYAPLETDVLKREFLYYFHTHDDLIMNAYRDFYFNLFRKNKQLAREFLENVSFNCLDEFSIKDIVVPFLVKEKKWQINPPPREAVLLFFMKIADASKFKLLLFPIETTYREDIHKYFYLSDLDESIFSLLDPYYAQFESYLKKKIIIAQAYQCYEKEREAICQILQLNPLLKEEFMPEFVRTMRNVKNKEKASQQISLLLSIFPKDFDLLRLSASFLKTPLEMKKLEYQFSSVLLQVLQLQIAYDNGQLSKTFYRNSFPYGTDEQADWRYFALLLKTSTKVPKKYFDIALKNIVNSEEKLINIVRRIYRYGHFETPDNFLKSWRRSFRYSWGWYYYLGINFLKKGQIERGSDYFKSAYKAMRECESEKAIIEYTMNFLCDMGVIR